MTNNGDVVDTLLAQHQRIKTLMDTVADASGGQRRQAFDELIATLRAHEHGEQTVTHAALRNLGPKDRDIAEQCVREERDAEAALLRVAALDLDSAAFDQQFGVFRGAVLEHAEYEEREEFPRLRHQLTAETVHLLTGELLATQELG